jgi:glycosyltransferase involved in cell wall biosynthesis
LGNLSNLKTPQAEYVINTFKEREGLEQVICRRSRGCKNQGVERALPEVIYMLLGAISKVFKGNFHKRFYEEEIFDWFASRKLRSSDVIFIHPARFGGVLSAAKKFSAVTVGIATTAHPEFNKALWNEELVTQGYSSDLNIIRLDIKNLNNFDYLIAYSDFAKDSFIENGFDAGRIFVANSDFDLGRFYSDFNQKKKGEFVAVFPAASTGMLKGLQHVIYAWDKFEHPSKKLIILGERKLWPKGLEKEISKKISGDETMIEKGVVSNPEDYYRQADVAILPSRTEGFSRSIAEAMASELPVITTEYAKGLMEHKQSGWIVPWRGVDEIAEALDFFANNPGERRRMGKNARNAIKTKKPFGEAVYEIYEEICRREGL